MPIQKEDMIKLREYLGKELTRETIESDRKAAIGCELKSINILLEQLQNN